MPRDDLAHRLLSALQLLLGDRTDAPGDDDGVGDDVRLPEGGTARFLGVEIHLRSPTIEPALNVRYSSPLTWS